MRVIFAAVQIGFALCMLATVDRIVSRSERVTTDRDIFGQAFDLDRYQFSQFVDVHTYGVCRFDLRRITLSRYSRVPTP